MKKLDNINRTQKLILDTIRVLNLNLAGMRILTEAGSGVFIVTPLIAALAGADKVYVRTRDSLYGNKEEILDYLNEVIMKMQLNPEIISVVDDPLPIADKINIVTNLGFVRPIHRELINKLPYDSAIPLMWETWELREEDVDLKSCLEYNIPVLGTNETDERLCIFRYVGMTVLKLLMEQNIEIFKSNVLVVSSGEYLKEIQSVLTGNGSNLFIYDPSYPLEDNRDLEMFTRTCDAIVIAEQRNNDVLISNNQHIHIDWLDSRIVKIIHVAGVLDYSLLERRNFAKYPDKKVGYGYMTVTTDYVGVRPVIELHGAGLKVGQALVEGMRLYNNTLKAKEYALKVSPAMDFEKGSKYFEGAL